MAGSSVLAKVAVLFEANVAEFKKSLNSAQSDLKKIQGGIQNVATAVGVGFGVRELVSFATESAKLAGQVESVGRAFNQLRDSKQLLAELKLVTGGTVSELKLMQATVQATNFGIAFKELPVLLEFATRRAQQTGQSVDYLVQSIILGIGRKSPMILDNLGISLVRLREKLKGVGAESASVAQMTQIVGEIAKEELGKMPGFADNAASAIERLGASFENLKARIGKMDWLQRMFDSLAKGMDELSGEPLAKTINLLERLNKVEGYGYTRGTTLKDIEEEIREIIEANGGLVISQQQIEERFGISSNRAKEYADILSRLNQEYKTAKILRETLAKGDVDPISGMASGGETWRGRPKIVKSEEELKAEQKAIDDHLKKLADAFKRYGTSIKVLNNATESDFKRFENNFNKAFIHTIDRFKETGSFEVVQEKVNDLIKTVNHFSKLNLSIGKNGKLLVIPFKPGEFDNIISKYRELGSVSNDVSAQMQADNELLKQSFLTMVGEGISAFSVGIGQLLSTEITGKQFGREILRMLAGFMKEFGKQLILIGLGMVTIGEKARGLKQIAIGTALSVGSGYITGKINNAEKREAEMEKVANRRQDVGLGVFQNKMEITGTLVGSGRDLVAVINQTNYDNKIRKGG